MKNILCAIGLHKWRIRQNYLPSINATVVTDWLSTVECERCKEIKSMSHLVWKNGDWVEKL